MPNNHKTIRDDNGRVCTKCAEYKTWDHYGKIHTRPDLKYPYHSCCKECKLEPARKWKKSKTAKQATKDRYYRLKKEDLLKWRSQQYASRWKQRGSLNVPTSKELELWLKGFDSLLCYYTGKQLTDKTFSIDHKQPLNRGGDSSFDNLALCHKDINSAKGNFTEKEFKDLLKISSKWEDKGDMLLRRLRMAGKAFGPK